MALKKVDDWNELNLFLLELVDKIPKVSLDNWTRNNIYQPY